MKKNFVKLKAVRGWLLDVYPSPTVADEVTVWVIAENGDRIKLVDRFTHAIYVYGDLQHLRQLAEKIRNHKLVADWRFVEKYPDFMVNAKRKVLEISVNDHRQISSFANELLRLNGFKNFRLYNVDVPVTQAYMYEKRIFPLAHVIIIDSGENLYYDLLDSVEEVDYHLPHLRFLELNVTIEKKEISPKLTDKINSIMLKSEEQETTIDDVDEAEKLLELMETVGKVDPDIILTKGGDSFLLPYLVNRASVNGLSSKFTLNRETFPFKAEKSGGTSFFSYGRIYHQAPMQRLYGRIHIDVDNTFIYTSSGLEGLIEVSRTCRFPLHRAARSSIGSIMSSLQLYTVWKEQILVPWKRNEPETFKTALDLLVADRGGFIFEPKIGFHTAVVEVDFTSMFPILMQRRNISAETVLCRCCPDSRVKVPELGYNLCEKRRGIVPKTLDVLLKKRLKYKDLMKDVEDEQLKRVYNKRQAALKWILVTCFGYLGYRNARFGKVDAHIAVCAFARDSLLKAAKFAEEHGFEVIHGIVDSLWLKKLGVSPRELVDFCRDVSDLVDVPLNVEGKYRWIVFLPSKVLNGVPVLNRYYGVYETGKTKLRGIETQRNDTPLFIVNAQLDVIKKLAAAHDWESFEARISDAIATLEDHARKLIEGEINVRELLITKRISKAPSGYSHDVFQAIAAKQLQKVGFDIYAGQSIQYVIANAKSKRVNERVITAQLLQPDSLYDTDEYLKLLFSAGETLLGLFGYTSDKIQDQVIHHQEQSILQN